MEDEEALEVLRGSVLRSIDAGLEDESYGLATKDAVDGSRLPWGVGRALLTELRKDGYLETRVMDGRIVGWFLTPKALDWLAADLEESDD